MIICFILIIIQYLHGQNYTRHLIINKALFHLTSRFRRRFLRWKIERRLLFLFTGVRFNVIYVILFHQDITIILIVINIIKDHSSPLECINSLFLTFLLIFLNANMVIVFVILLINDWNLRAFFKQMSRDNLSFAESFLVIVFELQNTFVFSFYFVQIFKCFEIWVTWALINHMSNFSTALTSFKLHLLFLCFLNFLNVFIFFII